jgi:hypothetical protein
VGLDSYVWKEGFDDWKVAGDVPELAQVFGGAAARPKGRAASVDDTSSFGPGRDLFGDGGREPTSEIETGGMFGSFDESPTPTGSKDSPVAVGRGGEALGGIGAGLGGGAMGAPQRMTGQRNENSVLFSLSNLQQLASGAGGPSSRAQASVSSAARSSPQAPGEGSGLIDIRALAQSTTPGTRSAPSQSVDDLLAIGTGGGGLGAPLLGPAPLETSDGSRWLWIAGAAVAVIAIVGAGIGVGMALGGGDDEALEITAAAEPQPGQSPPQAAQAIAAAQAPAVPEAEALADPEPAEENTAASIEQPAQAPEPSSEPEAARSEPRERRASSSPRRQHTERAAEQSQAPEPRERRGNNLDALMDEVVGGSPAKSTAKQASSEGSTDSSLPEAPSRDDVKTALQGVSGAVRGCKKDEGGTATVDVVFSGKTGRATSASVASGPFKGTPVGSCIEAAVKRARLPRFKQSSFKVTFPYRL